MLISVHHETEYKYAGPLNYSAQRLYLTPLSFASQRVLDWKITSPGVENALRYVDAFGNKVLLATFSNSEDVIKVVAEGQVETFDTAGIVKGLPEVVTDSVYLRQTGLTKPDSRILELAAVARHEVNVLDWLHRLMTEINAQIQYDTGATNHGTTAAQAMGAGRGVCQDYAHVFLGAARALHVPCRYVTGYLVTGIGARSSAAHAWVEALVPKLGWVGFDPTNCQSPTMEYVRVAAGIDAHSVSPVRGSRRGGGGGEELRVAVRVEIAQQ